MYLVFDTETTGLPRKRNAPLSDADNWPRMVQLAWELYDNEGVLQKSFNEIIKPVGYVIPPAMTAIHGISQEMALARGMDLDLVLESFIQTVTAIPGLRFVGHNVDFDRNIVGAELLRLGKKDFFINKEMLCTMRLGIEVCNFPSKKFPKLEELHRELFDVGFTGAHNALNDTRATAACFFEMKKRNTGALDNVNFETGIEINADFKEVADRVMNRRGNLLVTGRAGTGKSTLLRLIKRKFGKNAVVLAPTGIAALNAGGVTLHSFFGLPFHPLVPNDPGIKKLNGNKAKVAARAELIIIDEISMVRADILQAVDRSLRINGGNPELPFGGKQVLLFGDPYQLQPVVTGEESFFWQEHRDEYPSPYFFSAPAFARGDFYTKELTEVYRQRHDPDFLDMLSKIRRGEWDSRTQQMLDSRLQCDFSPSSDDFIITLAARNAVVTAQNLTMMAKLPGKPVKFIAKTEGVIPREPNDRELVLKIDAQVMFIKNDTDGRWVNGTLARVIDFIEDGVKVKTDTGKEWDVKPAMWESINYEWNNEKKCIEEIRVGSFTQLPLRPAWAVTVHKSQGLTFDRMCVDLKGGAFAHGQLYVALSRCRTLEGMILKSRIFPKDLIVDSAVTDFFELKKRL